MKYLDFPLGQLSSGQVVTVDLSGVESDVMLMGNSDVRSFATGGRFSYMGGHFKQSPVRIKVPNSGSWHVVVVPIGGRVEARVNVV